MWVIQADILLCHVQTQLPSFAVFVTCLIQEAEGETAWRRWGGDFVVWAKRAGDHLGLIFPKLYRFGKRKSRIQGNPSVLGKPGQLFPLHRSGTPQFLLIFHWLELIRWSHRTAGVLQVECVRAQPPRNQAPSFLHGQMVNLPSSCKRRTRGT